MSDVPKTVSKSDVSTGLTVTFDITVPLGACSGTDNLYEFLGNVGLLSLISVMVILTVAVDWNVISSSSVAITYTTKRSQKSARGTFKMTNRLLLLV